MLTNTSGGKCSTERKCITLIGFLKSLGELVGNISLARLKATTFAQHEFGGLYLLC